MFSFWNDLSKDKRNMLSACFLAFFLSGIQALMLGSILPDMRSAFGLSETQGGLLLSGHSVGNLIACLLSGLVTLRLGQRKGIMLLCSLSAVGFVMMLISGNPIWLLCAFVLTGVSRGSISNFNNYTVNRVTNGNPSAANVLHGCFAVGAISAPLLFLISNAVAGWRCAAIVVIALGALTVFKFSQQRLDNDASAAQTRGKSMAFLKNRSFLLFCGMMFFYIAAEYSVNGWLVTYLQSKPQLVSQFAAAGEGALTTYSQTMATLLWAVMLVGRLITAAIASKTPQKLMMMVDSVGVALFFALLTFGNSIATVTIAVVGLGFCMAGICPMIYSDASYITNVYPMGTSMILAVGSIGGILMPLLVGLLADSFGFAGGMCCILIGVVALLVLCVLNYRLKPQPIDGQE